MSTDTHPTNASTIDENGQFPLRDWVYAVQNGDTRLGFAEWVASQLEAFYRG